MARTPGATSCIAVKLSQLNQLLQPDAVILVSRRFANQIGLLGKPVSLTNDNLIAAGNPPAVTEKIPVIESLAVEAAPIDPKEHIINPDTGCCIKCGLSEDDIFITSAPCSIPS